MSTSIAQQLPAGIYELDRMHSSFGFAVKHSGVSIFRGEFEQVDASLQDGVLTGSAQVTSVKTAIPQLKDQLLSAEFFNAAESPEIAFRSTDIRVAEDGSAEVEGELSIRGVSKWVTAKGTYARGTGLSGSDVVGFDLEASIDRRDYGLNWQAPLPGGGDALGWGVSLQVHLQLAKA